MAQLTDDCFAFNGPLLPVADAERLIAARVNPVSGRFSVPLREALGRVLAADVVAPVDLVIVEGFKRHSHPKLEVYRAAVGKPLLHVDDDCIVAVATDAPLPQAQVPVVMLDDLETIANVLQAEALPREQIGKAGAERSTRAPQRSDA